MFVNILTVIFIGYLINTKMIFINMNLKRIIREEISEFDNLDWIKNIPDDVVGLENYRKYISGKPFSIRPGDMEVVGHDIKGRPIRKYIHREWDEIVPPEQVDRTSFRLQSNQVKYEIGDVITVKNKDVIKKVTITDVIETPYRNVSGGNAFVPHTFKYVFV